MEIKPKATDILSASEFHESQVLSNSLRCESEVKEVLDKKRQQKFGRSKDSSEVSKVNDTRNRHSPSVPDKKGVFRYKMKLSNSSLLLSDQTSSTSSMEKSTSLPQDHSKSKIKLQHMRLSSSDQDEKKSRLERFKTHSSDQGECSHLEHFKSSESDKCIISKTRLQHVKSASCDKCNKNCEREFTLTSFQEGVTCKANMAEQKTLLLVNGKQIPCLPARIKTEQFDFNTNNIHTNRYQLCPNIPQDEIGKIAIQNHDAIKDFNSLEGNKATSNSSPDPHYSRLTESSVGPIRLHNQNERADNPSLMLSQTSSAQKALRSVSMREAVDPAKYTKVPDGDGFKFQCSSCGNVYKWRKSLNKHWKEKHDMLWFRSTTLTGIDRKLVFPGNVDFSAEGSSLQGRTLTSAEYTRSFPYDSFYAHSSQLPFSMESSPSAAMWNLQLADPSNYHNAPSSALPSGLSENRSVRNFQAHDHFGRHMNDFCRTMYPFNHREEQISAGDLLLKRPSRNIGKWNISLVPQVTISSDKTSTVCPDRSCSSDQFMDCILDLSKKDQECLHSFPDILSSVQEDPLDLSVKSFSQRSLLQRNFIKKTKHAATGGASNTSTAVPCLSVKGTLCSTPSSPFCSRCSIRFSSVQGLNLHIVRNHSEGSIEVSDSTGNIEEKILPKIDNSICSRPSMCQSFNTGNTCVVCSVCFLTRQKLVQHFDKDHRYMGPNPYQACHCSEVPMSKVPQLDNNFRKDSTDFSVNSVVPSGCFRDALITETNESGCYKSFSKEIVPLNEGLVPNRTVSSFSDPSGMQSEEWRCEVEASDDGIRNSKANKKRRPASVSCIGQQDKMTPHLEDGALSDASNFCESNKTFSYNAMPKAAKLASFTHDAGVNSEKLTTLCKLGTHDIISNVVNLARSQQVINDAKTNKEATLPSSRGVKRSLSKSARSGRKDAGIGDKDLRYKCDFCDFRARWPSEMTQHKKNHSSDKPFKCNYCAYKSKWKWDVRKHLKRCGSEHQRLKKDAVCELEPVAADPDSSVQMPSQRAADTFLDSANASGDQDGNVKRSTLKRNLHHLVQQQMEKTKGKFNLENRVGRWNRVESAPSADIVNKDKVNSCSHCEFLGQSAAELKHHARVHIRMKPYTCKMCCYSTKWKSDLKKHMRTLSHELEGARMSVEEPFTSSYAVLNHAVCPPLGNLERKENSHESGMIRGKWNDERNSHHFGKIAFLDGRLQCRFCDYNGIEITLSQNHMCLINDIKASKEGIGDQMAFWRHLGLRKKTWDELKPTQLVKLVDIEVKLEEAGPGLNSPKVTSQAIYSSELNEIVSVANLTKFKLCEDTQALCVTSISAFEVDKSSHDVHEI